MKYQITCDNCGTQFIVEAGEGQVIECQCPHCNGIIEVTLPIVSGAAPTGEQTFEQPNDYIQEPIEGTSLKTNNQTVLMGVIIGLLVIALGIGAYFLWLRPNPAAPEPTPVTADTIPYEMEQEPTMEESIDTVAAPNFDIEEEVRDTVVHHRREQKQNNDTTFVDQ
ncbi:DnaJ-like cysteine-rich domain-containing protein [Prevotella falsenii]|uniref:zinc finger-like domain-containing protein n=1 Tax=Prevotella falsenii TaxID=515414 RepID=UPI0004681668|nr:zinc finger-like domain-containing protein [Prevotella falsenii]